MLYATKVEHFFAYHTRARACVRLCGKVLKHMRVDMFRKESDVVRVHLQQLMGQP